MKTNIINKQRQLGGFTWHITKYEKLIFNTWFPNTTENIENSKNSKNPALDCPICKNSVYACQCLITK